MMCEDVLKGSVIPSLKFDMHVNVVGDVTGQIAENYFPCLTNIKEGATTSTRVVPNLTISFFQQLPHGVSDELLLQDQLEILVQTKFHSALMKTSLEYDIADDPQWYCSYFTDHDFSTLPVPAQYGSNGKKQCASAFYNSVVVLPSDPQATNFTALLKKQDERLHCDRLFF